MRLSGCQTVYSVAYAVVAARLENYNTRRRLSIAHTSFYHCNLHKNFESGNFHQVKSNCGRLKYLLRKFGTCSDKANSHNAFLLSVCTGTHLPLLQLTSFSSNRNQASLSGLKSALSQMNLNL